MFVKSGSIIGRVIKGEGIAGREYGTPTANLDVADLSLDFGVYAAIVKYQKQQFGATVCYGVGEPAKFEVHLHDFSGDLLGQKLKIKIIEKVSELVDWQSTEQMRQKILHDIKMSQKVLKKRS